MTLRFPLELTRKLHQGQFTSFGDHPREEKQGNERIRTEEEE